VLGGFVGNLIGYRVRAVAERGEGLGKRQGGALGIGGEGRVAPGSDGSDPLVALACILEVARVRVEGAFQRQITSTLVFAGWFSSQRYDDTTPRIVRRRVNLTFRCDVSSNW
jgi:hypothetical protein